jgi:hypothetical protein
MPEFERARPIDARQAEGYRVRLKFADGLEGEIDFKDELWRPLFEQLKDAPTFAQLRFDPELRTIFWPNRARVSPRAPGSALYRRAYFSATLTKLRLDHDDLRRRLGNPIVEQHRMKLGHFRHSFV